MKPHTMELPRLISVGEGNMGRIGGFLSRLASPSRAALVSGARVRKAVGRKIEQSLKKSSIEYSWHEAPGTEPAQIEAVREAVSRTGCAMVAGVGGGRSVDVAKMVSYRLGLPFASVPTAASHDGIASPFVSVRGPKPHSTVASAPHGVFVDIGVIKRAPPRLLSSGCGDLIANTTAVRDWEIGHRRTGEYYGRYSASLALMSADMILENARRFSAEGPDHRIVVEALISAGVASCIAGSSRPCSGSEHLFSHALDRIAPGAGLHGEKCGLGAIMMAKLQGRDWKKIARALAAVGAPVRAESVGVSRAQVIEALESAQELRPGRHTVLAEKKMTRARAARLASDTGVA